MKNDNITSSEQITTNRLQVLGGTMMTSSNGEFSALLNLCESTAHRWIPFTKASDAELWNFLWSAAVQTVKQTIGTPVIWDAITFIMTSL